MTFRHTLVFTQICFCRHRKYHEDRVVHMAKEFWEGLVGWVYDWHLTTT